MQDIWFGDKRDVVKWGTMLHLANKHELKSIIQITYNTCPEKQFLLRSGNSSTGDYLPKAVLRFFWNPERIKKLGNSHLSISVFNERLIRNQRKAYHQTVLEVVQNASGRKAVLLDPDNGIKKKGNPTSKHVTASEIRDVWRILNERDLLVLYQHARHERDWKNDSRNCFAEALKSENGQMETHAEIYECPDIAKDVIFLVAAKSK